MKRREFLVVVLILLILSNTATLLLTRFLFSPALEMTRGENEAGLFWEVWDLIQNKYFQPVQEEKLVRGSIEGMLRALDDPYTIYLDSDSLRELLIYTTGSFSGIGVEITGGEDEVLVLRVIAESPAQRAGLLPGDRIVRVGERNIEGMAVDEVARLLRGPGGTAVDVSIRRVGEAEPITLSIIREEIERETVFPRLLDDSIGYLQITGFDQKTGKDFAAALARLEREGLSGLILDLRDNPGGIVEEAIEVGKIIVPAGEITRVVDRNGNVRERYMSHAQPRDYPIVVLINQYSASAAEIIAGALQDNGNATLVGTPSYGKATVQHLQYLSDGGGLRYTIAKYLTPAGHDLHENGLQPDVMVELPSEYYLQYRPIPRNLERGDTGEKVLLLQEMLIFLGYPMEKTGVFDSRTAEALLRFQREEGLPLNGSLDITTRERLRSALSEQARRADSQLLAAEELLK
ncbi:MAG: S41 family peptidase [Bacillota bacterium]